MYAVVKIGDKDVPMLAMASVDEYYKKIFNEDPLSAMTAKDSGIRTRMFYKMGFVMAKFAELKDRKKMIRLTEDDYIDWLDLFDSGEYRDAISKIGDVYIGNQKVTSREKKEAAR